MCVCVVCGASRVVCVCGVGGRWEGWDGEGKVGEGEGWGGGASTMVGGWWALCAVMCSTMVVRKHGETYGPNSREMIVGAFVAWCPPKYR